MITWRKKFIVVFFPLINVELQSQKADIFHDSDKLVITYLSPTIWPIFFSFLIFSCYFTRLKAQQTKSAKYEKLEKYWSYRTQNCAISNAYYQHGLMNYCFYPE